MKLGRIALVLLGMISVSWLSGCGKTDAPSNKADAHKGDTTHKEPEAAITVTDTSGARCSWRTWAESTTPC